MAPSKILAVKIRALGDSLLMTAPLAELSKAYPSAEIHLLVNQPWADLFTHFPRIKKIWTFERKTSRVARARFLARLAYLLRNERYDCVVNFHASPSSSLLAFATGAGIRSIHFHGHKQKDRYSTLKIPGKGTIKPIIERDMDTLRALGLHIPAGRLPILPLQSSETQEAKQILLQLNAKSPLLAMSLGASRSTKQWPVERFASLAIEWCKRESGSVLVFTGSNEEALQKAFMEKLDELLTFFEPHIEERSQLRRNIIPIHAPPLRTFAALLSQVSVWLGSDSGPKHLAVSVGTPTVSLFGPEHPFEWHPYPTDRNPYFFIEGLPCRRDGDPGMPAWCHLQTCIQEDNQCMKLLGTDAVLQACIRVANPTER